MPKATAATRRDIYSLALCRRIRSLQPPAGAAALWWMGQSGFVIKLAGRIIYLDVFFSPMRQRVIPPLLPPQHVTHADIICGTHDHIVIYCNCHLRRRNHSVVSDATNSRKNRLLLYRGNAVLCT